MRVCCIIKVPESCKTKMEKVASPFWENIAARYGAFLKTEHDCQDVMLLLKRSIADIIRIY